MMQDARYLSTAGGSIAAMSRRHDVPEPSAKQRLRVHIYVSFFAANLLTWIGAGYMVAHSLA